MVVELKTHFRNTVVADVTLAAYVKASIRYRVIGRLGGRSGIYASISSLNLCSQAGHETETKYPGADYGHYPVDLSIRGPSVPAIRLVSDRQ